MNVDGMRRVADLVAEVVDEVARKGLPEDRAPAA